MEEEGDSFYVFDIDIDSLQEPGGCFFYCDPCATMFTISGLMEAQSDKGYRHSNSLRELGERTRPRPSLPPCSLCEVIINEGDTDGWVYDERAVVFFLALNKKQHRLDYPESNLMPFDGLVGYLFDKEKGSYFDRAIVRFVAIADDSK